MTPTTIVAFCPGHISGYFKRIEGETDATTGSIGAGIVISEGVTATVQLSDISSIHVRRSGPDGTLSEVARTSPILFSVMDRLAVTASVVTDCHLPIGAGFGLSAAALLATITGLNRLFDLGLDAHEVALYAHEAEVTHRTGLGDVAACQGGGMVIRKGPGIDAIIDRRFDLTDSLYAMSFGPIHTPSVLGSPAQMERIGAAFPSTSPEDPVDFFRLSRQFANNSRILTPEVKTVIDTCNEKGVPASMTMLGNGVFAYGKKAKGILIPYGQVYEFHVASTGVRIVEEVP